MGSSRPIFHTWSIFVRTTLGQSVNQTLPARLTHFGFKITLNVENTVSLDATPECRVSIYDHDDGILPGSEGVVTRKSLITIEKHASLIGIGGITDFLKDLI